MGLGVSNVQYYIKMLTHSPTTAGSLFAGDQIGKGFASLNFVFCVLVCCLLPLSSAITGGCHEQILPLSAAGRGRNGGPRL